MFASFPSDWKHVLEMHTDHSFSQLEAAVERAFKHFRLLRERRTTPPEVIAGWLENHLELYDMICKLIRICIDYASTSKRSGRDRSQYQPVL